MYLGVLLSITRASPKTVTQTKINARQTTKCQKIFRNKTSSKATIRKITEQYQTRPFWNLR